MTDVGVVDQPGLLLIIYCWCVWSLIMLRVQRNPSLFRQEHVGMRCQPVFRVGLVKFVPVLQECFAMQSLKKVRVPYILMANRVT